MRIRIRHVTHYRYDRPIELAAQIVRLAPRDHDGQRVLSWRVTDAAGKPLPRIEDGYGNLCHVATMPRHHAESAVIAEGEIETSDTSGMVRGAAERLPPLYYLRRTAMTTADAAIEDLAAEHANGSDAIERLHRLTRTIRDRVSYQIGATDSATSAAEALARGRGVCQDHAHVLIACARLLGLPARYVSGYLWEGPRDTPGEASHAWAEVHVERLGWIGFDAANGVSPTDAYARVAIGLDYREAAPIRGIRRGTAVEALDVSVDVRQTQAQQMQSQIQAH